MKFILLTQNKVAIVDDEDYEVLSRHKWHAHKRASGFYAERSIRRADGTSITIGMHREIMNCPLGMQIDHANGDTLDERKSNLRTCDRSKNQANWQAIWGVSKFKGVSYRKSSNKWRAYICPHNRTIHIGHFDSEIEAARAYDQAALKYFGEFAKLNFQRELAVG